MNITETIAELKDSMLKGCGWGVIKGSKIHCEINITTGNTKRRS